MLSDPAALERYQGQAAAIDSARVDALVWFETGGVGPVATLVDASNPTGFTLGLPSGFRRADGGDFLLTISVAGEARFGIVGAAARDGNFGRVDGDEPLPAGAIPYAEACGASSDGP